MSMEFFDSFEEMVQSMHEAEKEANRNTTPEQKTIGYGDYFLRTWEIFGDHLRIYGRIMTRDEFIKSEKDCGAPDEELEHSLLTHDNSYARGYRFGWCYSEVEPEGEIGSTHISVMKKISEEDFNKAKARGWR